MEKIATLVKRHPLVRFAISYFARAMVLVLALYVIACTMPLMPPLVMAVVLAVMCAVSMVSVAYHTVAHKVLKNMQYRAGGRMNGLNEGRKLCLTMSFVTSLYFMVTLFLDLPEWRTTQWVLIALSVIVFFFVFLGVKSQVRIEVEDPFVSSKAALISCGIVGLLLCVGYAGLLLGDPAVEFGSVEEAYVSAMEPYENASTALLAEAGKVNAIFDGLSAYGLSRVAQYSSNAYLVLQLIFGASALFGFANLLGSCALSFRELRQVFRTIESSKKGEYDGPVLIKHVGFACALPMLFILVFLGGNAFMEDAARTQEYTAAEAFVREQLAIGAAAIDGKLYNQVALEELMEQTSKRSSDLYDQASATLVPLINEVFDKRIENVDGYLDWYYSLPADYERIAQFFKGTIEDGMKEQLELQINQGVDDAAMIEGIESYYSDAAAIEADYREALSALEIVDVPDWLIETKSVLDVGAVQEPLEPMNRLLSAGERYGISAAAGAGAGFVTAKVTEKIIAKPFFNKIVARLVSALGTRAGVQLVSTSAGTIMSPGVGSVLGAVGGTAVSVLTDYLFLKADEVQNREEYRVEIVEAIEGQREELLASIGQLA